MRLVFFPPIVSLPVSRCNRAIRCQVAEVYNVFASPAGDAETPVDMETISLDPEAEVKAGFCPYGLDTAARKGGQRQALKPG